MPTERLQPARGPICGAVRPPGSKSLTNRALVAAGLADGESLLAGCLASDDTRYMADAWRTLGARIDWPAEPPAAAEAAPTDAGPPVTVRGTGGRLVPGPLDLFVGNAGTAMRFLTAVVAAGQGDYRLDGAPRMRERPIEDLLAALRALGVDARSAQATGCPPVVVRADGLPGGRVAVSGRISSQFLSGLLLAAPCARADVRIDVDGDLVSKPYAEMTCRLMADFAVRVANEDYRRFHVPAPQRYAARAYDIEPDATAATYFWAAAALTAGSVTVEGLTRRSAQGDVGFLRILQEMGCAVGESRRGLTVTGPRRLRAVQADLNAMPDTALTLAVLALFADGETLIENVANLRVKETDRLAALAAELRKFGADVREAPDALRIAPPPAPRPAAVDTYDDHRMAMSFALAGLLLDGVEIRDPQCVTKTFPGYFAALRRLAGQT